jgi:hypothetical protein
MFSRAGLSVRFSTRGGLRRQPGTFVVWALLFLTQTGLPVPGLGDYGLGVNAEKRRSLRDAYLMTLDCAAQRMV